MLLPIGNNSLYVFPGVSLDVVFHSKSAGIAATVVKSNAEVLDTFTLLFDLRFIEFAWSNGYRANTHAYTRVRSTVSIILWHDVRLIMKTNDFFYRFYVMLLKFFHFVD